MYVCMYVYITSEEAMSRMDMHTKPPTVPRENHGTHDQKKCTGLLLRNSARFDWQSISFWSVSKVCAISFQRPRVGNAANMPVAQGTTHIASITPEV